MTEILGLALAEAEDGGPGPPTLTNDHLVGYSLRDSAKSSDFASVAISCSCPDIWYMVIEKIN